MNFLKTSLSKNDKNQVYNFFSIEIEKYKEALPAELFFEDFTQFAVFSEAHVIFL